MPSSTEKVPRLKLYRKIRCIIGWSGVILAGYFAQLKLGGYRPGPFLTNLNATIVLHIALLIYYSSIILHGSLVRFLSSMCTRRLAPAFPEKGRY